MENRQKDYRLILVLVMVILFLTGSIKAQTGAPDVVSVIAIDEIEIDSTGVTDINSGILPDIGQAQHRLTVRSVLAGGSAPCSGLGLIVLEASQDGTTWFTAGQGLMTTGGSGFGYVDVTAAYPAVRARINNWKAVLLPCDVTVYYTGTVNPVALSKVDPAGWDFGMITAARSLTYAIAETQEVIVKATDSIFDLPANYSVCIYGGYISSDAAVTLTLSGSFVSSKIYMAANSTFNFGQSVYPIVCRSPDTAFTIETSGAANLGLMLQYRYELR